VGVSEQRGSAIAAGEWQCIHIPQGRVFVASYRTFIGTLHADHSINFDMRTEYPVYSAPAPEGDGMCFFFSPPAAQRFKSLIKFWGGFPFQEPKHLNIFRRIL
jgi:hypothetical protein